MTRDQVIVLLVALVLCVAVGILIPMASQADALASVDQALDHFLWHLNQVPY